MSLPRPSIGLDFGTTNSAVALVDERGVRLLRLDGERPTFRSVLCFDPDLRERGRLRPLAGPRAIERFVELGGEGRFLQSLKSYLPSRSFQASVIFGQRFPLEELIGLLVAALRSEAERDGGPFPPQVVVGRPVHFVGADSADDDARAEARLRAALGQAGLTDVVFELEPVGAAWAYASRLSREELVLIADFGGGTSDFCLVRLQPFAKGAARHQILGTAGLGLAGDALDGQLVRHVVAPHLGKGTTHRPTPGKHVALPAWLFSALERWHTLSFLKTADTLAFVESALKTSSAPERIEALLHVVESDLGLALHRAVQQTKLQLSQSDRARFSFDDGVIRIDAGVTRAQFERWIEPQLQAIGASVDGLLSQTAIRPDQVDRVFLTGGTALVPAVRRLFADRFGDDRLAGGEELTSVATGLALRARELG